MKNRIFLALLFVLPASLQAHHSRSLYHEEIREWEGEVIDIQWKNPHVMFSVRSTDEAGNEVVDQLEANSIYMLQRGGAGEDVFRVGTTVRVAARPSRIHDNDYVATNMLLPDGVEVIMVGREPRWPNVDVIGNNQWEVDQEQIQIAATDGRGIFRVWSSPVGGGGLGEPAVIPLKESALAARAEWDVNDNYITRCEPHGMPRIMANPHPIEFIDNGGTITLLNEEYDTVRTIYLDEAGDPQSQPHSHLGYSVGRWEGDTLVVETTRINWPYFDNEGTPQSEDVHIEERFTLIEEEGTLMFVMTVTDPSILDGPAVWKRGWLAQGEQVEEYNCQAGAG